MGDGFLCCDKQKLLDMKESVDEDRGEHILRSNFIEYLCDNLNT